jgi:hypothetical protein
MNKKILLSEKVKEDHVVFFIGNETKPNMMEMLGRRFPELNFDHVMNALWMSEHQATVSIAPGVRTFCGQLAGIDDIHVAIGISKQTAKIADVSEQLFFFLLMPYENRFENRAFVRAASRLFQKPNLVAQLAKLWCAEDVMKALRDAEQPELPHEGVFIAA